MNQTSPIPNFSAGGNLLSTSYEHGNSGTQEATSVDQMAIPTIEPPEAVDDTGSDLDAPPTNAAYDWISKFSWLAT